MIFLQPKIHWQGAKDGMAVSEMPLINYSVAALWKVFGKQEGIYRLFNYLIFICSIFILFTTLQRAGNSGMVSFFCVSLILTSPLLVYYAYNFLADVPAFALATMGFCFLFSFYKSKKLVYFYLALLVSTIAVLIKASAVFPLAFMCFFVIIELFQLNNKFKTEKLFSNKIIPSLALLIAFILIALWYNFAKAYNLNSQNAVFLLDILPVWNMNEGDVFKNLSVLLSDLLPVFFNRPVLLLFVLAIGFVSVNFKLLNAFLKYAFVFSALFFISFICLFFQVFDVHDYYLINMMIFPIIILFCTSHILIVKNYIPQSQLFLRLLILIVFLNAFYSAAYYRVRTIKDDKLCYWYPFISKFEKNKIDEEMWNHKQTMGKLPEIQNELRKMGIKRNEIFISVPDNSPNISLYFLDQKGFNVPGEDFAEDTLWKSRTNFDKAAYLVMNDSMFKHTVSFKNIEPKLKRILKREHVEVYKINS